MCSPIHDCDLHSLQLQPRPSSVPADLSFLQQCWGDDCTRCRRAEETVEEDRFQSDAFLVHCVWAELLGQNHVILCIDSGIQGGATLHQSLDDRN